MPIIKVRFKDSLQEQSEGGNLDWVAKLILTRSNLTHVELQFSEAFAGVSWSFTMAEGVNGARFRKNKYSHETWWRTIAIGVTEAEELAIVSTACFRAGVSLPQLRKFLTREDQIILQGDIHWKYDLKGLLTFALRKAGVWWIDAIRGMVWCWTKLIKPSTTADWCSSGVGFVLYLSKLVQQIEDYRPEEMSPQDLYEVLQFKLM